MPIMLQRTRGIWRLPKLGAEWGIGSTDIRLPPLPPGTPFQDVYQVRAPLPIMANPSVVVTADKALCATVS